MSSLEPVDMSASNLARCNDFYDLSHHATFPPRDWMMERFAEKRFQFLVFSTQMADLSDFGYRLSRLKYRGKTPRFCLIAYDGYASFRWGSFSILSSLPSEEWMPGVTSIARELFPDADKEQKKALEDEFKKELEDMSKKKGIFSKQGDWTADIDTETSSELTKELRSDEGAQVNVILALGGWIWSNVFLCGGGRKR
jgi:hypothetical protein